MASGYIAGQEINGQKAYLFWSYTQDIATRKTTITFTFKVKRVTSTYSTYKSNCNVYIEAPNGTDIYNQSTYDYDITSIGVGSYLTLASASKTFTHGTDGKLADVTCDSGIDLTGTSIGEYLNASGSIAVDDIPVGSDFNGVYGVVIGELVIIEIDTINSAYNHTVKYTWYGSTVTVGTNLTGTSPHVSFTPPLSLANSIPNSKTGTIKYTIETYSGTTLIGTKTRNVTMSVPSTMKPTIDSFSAGIADIHSDWGVWVKGKSQAILQWAGVGGVYGSTAKTWAITATGHSYSDNVLYGSESCYSNVLTNVGNITFTIVITDSRGMTNSKTVTIAVQDYAPPVISAFTAVRATGGVAADDGTQILTHQVYSISSCGGHNTLSVQKINIKQLPSGAFGSDIAVVSGTDKVNSGPYSVDYSYQVRLTLTDGYSTVYAYMDIQPTYSLVEFYGATGKGISFGEKATADGFWVNMLSTFKQGLRVLGRLVTYFSTASGDCNNITDEWHLGGNGSANYPIVGSTIWWYVNTIFYSSTTGGGKQIAYGYNGTHKGRVFTRNMYQGVWDTTWVEELNTASAGLAIKGLEQITSANLQATDNFLMGDVSDSDNPKRTELQSIAAYIARTITITMTRNTTNTSAATGSCKYFPELGIVVFNYRFTCTAFSAATAKVLGNIGSTYAPTVTTAIQAIHGTSANSCSVYIDGTGNINFINEAAVSSGSNVYLMGTWQV